MNALVRCVLAPMCSQEAVRTPGPVADDRIDEARHADGVEDVADEIGAADHRAGADGRGAVGEGELEDPVGQHRHAGARRRGSWP